MAAQTLGRRTMEPDGLKDLVEGKFVDALRSIAAEMTMEEMHEKRGEYVKRVRAAVADALTANGLELEGVSLTGLDQTNMEYFNPSNAFDAEGLTRLTEEIERRKKIRNDIEQDTLIQIRNKNLEAERLSLTIDRDSEYARLEQDRELEVRRAAQRTLDAERIARERDIQGLEVARRQALELAEQARAVAVADASRAQSEAQAEAERARALAVTAEEAVFTAREREIAERRKAVELIEAAQGAEREAIRLRVTAEAERAAAGDRAEAQRIAAEAEADSEKIRALAARLRHEIEAEGARLMHEAENVLSDSSRAGALRLRLVERLDAIIRESVKPMEKIEGIRIVQVDGLGGGGPGAARGEGQGSFPDAVVNSALRYRAQAPLVDHLLKEIGLNPGAIGGLVPPVALGIEDETPKKAAE
jgi:uncharacterized membrane protein YqiK